MSPIWKILGWSSSFSQKMLQRTFWLDWSVIFRLVQKSGMPVETCQVIMFLYTQPVAAKLR